ncbi:MAG: hypothetical protein AVDCRST_MAG88-4441, partial [uncultured Thermomicrobiales bacterium]
ERPPVPLRVRDGALARSGHRTCGCRRRCRGSLVARRARAGARPGTARSTRGRDRGGIDRADERREAARRGSRDGTGTPGRARCVVAGSRGGGPRADPRAR